VAAISAIYFLLPASQNSKDLISVYSYGMPDFYLTSIMRLLISGLYWLNYEFVPIVENLTFLCISGLS
jgi:hypothetical protein